MYTIKYSSFTEVYLTLNFQNISKASSQTFLPWNPIRKTVSQHPLLAYLKVIQTIYENLLVKSIFMPKCLALRYVRKANLIFAFYIR